MYLSRSSALLRICQHTHVNGIAGQFLVCRQTRCYASEVTEAQPEDEHLGWQPVKKKPFTNPPFAKDLFLGKLDTVSRHFCNKSETRTIVALLAKHDR